MIKPNLKIILSNYQHADYIFCDTAHLTLYPIILKWLK